MRRTFRSFMCAFFAAAVSSCGGVARYVNPARPPPVTVRLWVEAHASLPRPDALLGCQVWAPKGIDCVLVEDEEGADIRVYAVGGACLPNAEGRRTLALAYAGGKVEFNVECFIGADGRLDTHEFRAVMGHEVGHELGIWEHVGLECDGHAPRHPAGGRVCGRAIMNPYYDERVHYMTPIDALAFDLRETDRAVIKMVPVDDRPGRAGEAEDEGPLCEYFDR